MSMEKYYTPTEWENYPSEDTAINAMRLNHAEDGINELDDRIVELSTDKSEVDWNQILLSGEKIAEITINGIKKDVYNSNDSAKAEAQAYKAEGYATGEQNGIPVESGSPYYHNNSKYFSEQASDSASDASASAVEAGQSADDAEEEALVSEGWANGKQNGVPVEEGSPYYHNNAEYWSQQSNPTRFGSLSDVDFGILRDDDIPVYDATSEKWVNEVGVSTEIKNASVVSGETKIRTRTGGILQSCGVKLDPVQDLHGYSKPWVGGSGKNKIPIELSTIKSLNTNGTWTGNVYSYGGIDFTVYTDTDGNVTGIKANGTASSASPLVLLTGWNYAISEAMILSGCPSGGSSSTYDLRVGRTSSDDVYNDYGSGITIPSGKTMNRASIVIRNGVTIDNIMFYPMVRFATVTDATFEPYTNICSISGHDEIAINNDPKNWIPYIEDGDLNVTTGAEEPTANRKRSSFIAIDRTKRYVISGFNVSMYGADVKVCHYNANKTFTGGEFINISQGQDIYFPSFSIDTAYIRFAASSSVITNKMQAEIGTVSTAYDPYREPEQTTIDIDSTVYGGELDVVSGSGSDEWANIASYNGETITEPWLSSMDEYVSGGTPTTGAQVVYKKATSTTASCTPTPVETLPNTNVMYAPSDGQTLMSAEYREAFAWSDVKSAIAHALAALT